MNIKILWIVVVIIALAIVSVFLFQKYNAGPRIVSIDPETGRNLIEIQYCSDVCPDYTRTYIVLEGVDSPEQCEALGGVVIRDFAWGGYIGCGPSLRPQY